MLLGSAIQYGLHSSCWHSIAMGTKVVKRLQHYRIHVMLLIYVHLVWTSSAQRTSIVNTFSNSEDTTLSHMVMDLDTETIYIGALNYIYRVNNSLYQLEKVQTGPEKDNKDCILSRENEPDMCKDTNQKLIPKESRDNENKILVIYKDAGKLVTCGTVFQGTCELRNLTQLSESRAYRDSNDVMVASNTIDSSTVAFLGPGPPNELLDQVLYTGASYSGAEVRIRKHVPAVSSRSVKGNEAFNLVVKEDMVWYLGSYVHFDDEMLIQQYIIEYIAGFSVDGFSYFLTVQKDGLNNTARDIKKNYVSKIVQVCQNDRYYNSYMEMTIKCGDNNILQAATVANASRQLANTLNIREGDKVLMAVFATSEPDSKTPTNSAAVCMYSFKGIRDRFTSNIRRCYNGEGHLLFYLQAESQKCVSISKSIDNNFCGLEADPTTNRGIQGIDDLAFNLRYPLDSRLVTSITSSTINENNILFIGTADGRILKMLYNSQSEANIYDIVDVEAGKSINRDMIVDRAGKHLYVMTKKTVYKLKTSQCEQYSNCTECLRAKDPHCGWCSLQNRCMWRSECARGDKDAKRWVSYVANTCMSFPSVSSYKMDVDNPRQIEISVEHLPTSNNEKYKCLYGKNAEVAATVAGELIQCPPPSKLPIPENDDNVNSSLSLKSEETGVIFKEFPFVFYRCMAHTPGNDGEPMQNSGCTRCTAGSGGGRWGCHWCVYDNVCQNERTACSSYTPSDVVSSQGECPRVEQPLLPAILIPAGVPRKITLKTRNLPEIKNGLQDYECVVHVRTPPMRVPAQRIDSNTLQCEAAEYDINEKTKDVSIEVVWNNAFYLDDTRGTSVMLYKCELLGDDCGLCLSLNSTDPQYGCQWCNSRCKYNSTCSGSPASSCPKPLINSVSPLSGPREGGTKVTISGSNLGSSFSQIKGVTIAEAVCDLVKEEYQTSKSIVCLTGSAKSVKTGKVVITIEASSSAGPQEVTWREDFAYKDVMINRFDPTQGPISGGTMLTIDGRNLNISSSGLSNPTVTLDNHPCIVTSKSEAEVVCRTTSVASHKTVKKLNLTLDYAIKILEMDFYYRPDPNITKIDPLTIYSFGGRQITVTGENLDVVQNPQMFISSSQRNTSRTPCNNKHSGKVMYCLSPELPELSRKKRQTSSDKYYFNFIMDGVKEVQALQNANHLDSSVRVVPNPKYAPFVDGIRYYKGDILVLEGEYLNLASTKEEINVTIGNEQCKVESLSEQRLLCKPPDQSPRAQSGKSGPEVHVTVGNKLFKLGELVYQKQASPLPVFAIIILAAGGGIILFIFVAVVVMYRRRSQEAERQIKKMLIQLDTLESNVRNECKQAFAELQTEVSDLTSDLNMTGIPFWDYRNYTFKVLFPSHTDHPVLHNDIPIHDTLRLGNMERGLQQFNQLINSKQFLLIFIRTLELQKNFSIRDKAVVASLLMVVLQDKMEYATDVLKSLLNDLIDKAVEKKTSKLLFRRTESVVEKFLTNWLSLCMYDNIKRQTGRPLFLLYKAIKHQTEKGPVDAITAEARYSLSEDRLLREKIEPKTLNVQLLVENQEPIQCKMLDCDTITQAKEKALDAIYMNNPHSKRPSVYDVDLEWRSGRSGHLPLQDEDVTTEMIKGWKRVNMLCHYHVPDGAVMALIPKRNKNDQVRQVHGMVEITSGSLTTLSPIITVEEGTKVWHLVKHDDVANQARTQKVISEIFLTRLLTTKGTIQQYIDDLFMTILRVDSTLPTAIKYLFDFLDNAARRHGITESEIVHTWKSNSLPLRFWVNILKNPEFVFDIHKSHIVDSCLSVIAQTFMDSCSTSEHKLGKDSPTNKLLFARDIPKYRKWVDRFFREVQEMTPVTDQEMSITMTELSMQYRVDFNTSCALKELYRYASSYNFELLESLEDDPSAKKLHLSQKFEQVVAAIDGVPMY